MNDIVEGMIGVVIAIFFFGSNFIPVKQYKTGDGLFFQFFLCIGIWLVGLTVNLIRSEPDFQPIAMCGGILWCTGNLLCVPIINRIGLGLGLLIWGSTGMISGWLSGVVGLMDIKKQTDDITSWPLNIIGVILALISMGFATQVKPGNEDKPDLTERLIDSRRRDSNSSTSIQHEAQDVENGVPATNGINSTTTHRFTKTKVDSEVVATDKSNKDRIVGCSMAMVAGIFFGINFDPPQYVMDRVDGSSQNSLDYVFPHFCGILLASIFWFSVYCGYKWRLKTPIEAYPEVILPAIISGIMWGIAQTGFFVANEKLAFVVSFPLISLGPGFVGLMWSIFLFKEIQGKRNYYWVLVMFIFSVGTSACIVLSRE